MYIPTCAYSVYLRRFHALLKTYEQLAELILYTMRIDVRCRLTRYLELASRHVSIFSGPLWDAAHKHICRVTTTPTEKSANQTRTLST
jgi:hypothetical protein